MESHAFSVIRKDHPVRLIDIKTVEQIVGCRKTVLYERIKRREFPPPCHVGRSARWVEREIVAYVEQRIAERDKRFGGKEGQE